MKEVPPYKLNIAFKFITQENLETHYEKPITYSKEKQKYVKIQPKDNGNCSKLATTLWLSVFVL